MKNCFLILAGLLLSLAAAAQGNSDIEKIKADIAANRLRAGVNVNPYEYIPGDQTPVPDGSGFIAASDENGVYHVSWTGETVPLYVSDKWLDCEGVTIDPEGGSFKPRELTPEQLARRHDYIENETRLLN